MKNSQFKVGDQVEWASTSNGSKKTKRGAVEAVIGAGKYPSDAQCKEVGTSGLARDHESYMVRVPGKTSASKGKLYWPRVSALKHGLCVLSPNKVLVPVTDEMVIAALAAHYETRSSHPLNAVNRKLNPGEMEVMQKEAMRNAIAAALSISLKQPA